MGKHNLKVLYGKVISSEATYRFVLCLGKAISSEATHRFVLCLILIFINCLLLIEDRFITFTMMQTKPAASTWEEEHNSKLSKKPWEYNSINANHWNN